MTEGELLRRLDRTIEENSRIIERNSGIIERNSQVFDFMAHAFERFVRSQARLERTIDDLRDQIRANTAATLRLIDRLAPEPGTAV